MKMRPGARAAELRPTLGVGAPVRLATVCSLLLTISALTPPSPTPQGPPAAQACSSATGVDPQFACIRVLDSTGAPLAGAAIVVQVIPQDQDKWGSKPYPLAGSAMTDASGHILTNFISPQTLKNPSLISSDSVVNYDLYLVGAGGTYVPLLVLPRYYGTNKMRAAEFADVAAQYATTQLTVEESQQYYGKGPRNRGIATRGQIRQAPHICLTSWKIKSEKPAWTIVGELHTEDWVDSASFTYGAQADSNIEVAVSADGVHFSPDGTLHLSSSRVGTFKQVEPSGTYGKRYGRQQQTLMTYALRAYVGTCPSAVRERLIATGWRGGLRPGADTSGQDDHDVRGRDLKLLPYQQFTTTTTIAKRYDAGVDIFGVKLQVQSGYSVNVELHWETRSGSGCLYGNDAPPLTARVIYVATSGC